MSAQTSRDKPRGLPPIVDKCPQKLESFQIMTWSGESEEPPAVLDQRDIRHSILTAGVHFAIVFLENAEGKKALRDLGLEICNEWARPKNKKDQVFPEWMSERIEKDIDILVNFYLIKLREQFCNLIVAHPAYTTAACYMKPREGSMSIARDYERPESYDPDWYNPKDGVILVNDGGMLEVLVYTQKFIEKHPELPVIQNANRQFKNVMMALSMKLSHELGHGFTAFLSWMHGCSTTVHTPGPLFWDFPGYIEDPHAKGDTKPIGEAGYLLERKIWGGDAQLKGTGDCDSDFDNFLWCHLEVRVWDEDARAIKYRVITDEIIEEFFTGPQRYALTQKIRKIKWQCVDPPSNSGSTQSVPSPRGGEKVAPSDPEDPDQRLWL
ncbi:hypothetical protein GE09DRAFT_1192046, partial [Coniochaeta sp. 2T2.1]